MTKQPIRIAILGDYRPEFEPHPLTDRALGATAAALGVHVAADWVPTERLTKTEERADAFDGLWIAPGSPYRNLEGVLEAIRVGREHGVPTFGTCAGFQHMALEYAMNVAQIDGATSSQYDPGTKNAVIEEFACSLAGQEMMVRMTDDSRARDLYGRAEGLSATIVGTASTHRINHVWQKRVSASLARTSTANPGFSSSTTIRSTWALSSCRRPGRRSTDHIH